MNQDVIAYLDRIGYYGSVDTSIATLTKLQECHVHTVPWENLDILKKIPLSLDIPDLIDKIIYRKRGGYCFELNALFEWLLRELGFKTTNLFGRFLRDEPITPAKRRHHILQVKINEQKYITDVGVGGKAPYRPIQMVDGLIQEQGDESYQLQRDPLYGWILHEKKSEKWYPIYSFTEEPNLPHDYITTSYWCENSPDSPFVNHDKIAIRTKEGRNTVVGTEFRIFTSKGVRTFKPNTHEEYTESLHTYFGIRLK